MTAFPHSLFFPIADSTQVGEARRAASALAEHIELDESQAGKFAVLVTELASNLLKHARDGVILLRTLGAIRPGLEVLSIDKGPGMNVEQCFRDGYSTGGTQGTGLGSISRMADRWDVYSALGGGTVLMAQIHSKISHRPVPRVDLGAVTLPFKGERCCGDNWAHLWNPSRERFMIADGLGHGQHAAEASDEAATAFHRAEGAALPDLMQTIHNSLKKTRGAAVAVAELDFEQRVVRFIGVGNIAATVVHQGTTRSLVSQNGTVGHELRRIQEFQYPWPKDALVVMASDGLQTKWDLAKYPGLSPRHPSLVSGVLWRDFTRGRDDVTVLAVREKPLK